MSDKNYPSQSLDVVNVRLPDGMRDALKAAAMANGRTMNAEAVVALVRHLNGITDGDTDMPNGTALKIRLSEEMRSKLDAISSQGPYRISITSIVERGIELAAEELADLNGKRAQK